MLRKMLYAFTEKLKIAQLKLFSGKKKSNVM